MKPSYRGPFAWFRQWNFKRVERRRWFRELFEAIPATDAAMLEGLARLLERSAEEASVQAVRQGIVDQKFEALAGQLSSLQAELERRTDRVADLAAERMVALLGDGFPSIKTERAGLLGEPELDLMAGLAELVSPRVAFDVGAHHGIFSEVLLAAGFEVHALEPSPGVFKELVRRLGSRAGFKAHQVAAGSAEGEAELGLVTDPTGNYGDPTRYGSIADLPLAPGLVRSGSVKVRVRRLDDLVRDLGITPPSIIKVDAEGTDLEVMRGLGALRPAVLQVEFWDETVPLSSPGATNRVPELAAQARLQGLPWSLVVFRQWGSDRIAFYANRGASPERSWGNAFFFADQAIFQRAHQLLVAALPEARFVAMPKG
jgi:FkbM family methyltransferase